MGSFKCDVCGREFDHSCLLETHYRIHTVDKPVISDICSKAFIQSLSVDHTYCRKRTGEELYKCDVCDIEFTQLSVLYIHKRIHTEEKPYNCDVCGN